MLFRFESQAGGTYLFRIISVQPAIEIVVARPREFNEEAVLTAAVDCFWGRGYDATSVRHLVDKTGITGASLYNAFGDKKAIYKRALETYIEVSIADRIRRCIELPPRDAITSFFEEIVKRSLSDSDQKGCMLVNASLEAAPSDPDIQEVVVAALDQIQSFFLSCITSGKACGSITSPIGSEDLARHLLGVLMGVRVLARVSRDPELLRGIVAPALTMIDAKV